jgi:sodium/bile acid cotransporter 3/5
MMPLWMNLLGYRFLEMQSSNVIMKVPYSKIIASLGGLIVPLLIGVAIARWKPEWGANARKVGIHYVYWCFQFDYIFRHSDHLWFLFWFLSLFSA